MLVGVALGILGAAYVIFKGKLSNLLAMKMSVGDLSMLGAVFIYALYSVLLPKAPKIHPNSLLASTIILGTVVLFPVYIVNSENNLLLHLPDLAWPVLYIAIFPSILAYRFWNYGVAEIGASSTGLFICFIPVFTAIIAAVFLEEPLYYFHAVGLFLIVLSVLAVHHYRRV
jgi:drug/metabolite transporter (DMT)-like permease